MKLQEYVDWTENTCAKLSDHRENNLHMVIGMLTEIGELADPFKKELAYSKDIDWVNVEEELGDIMFYIASFCRLNTLDLSDIILKNIEKLEARYPEKFTQYHATHRDLAKEREILER
jgi:NTP pyrophosphatase (non-canonical NTP hydrolase)